MFCKDWSWGRWICAAVTTTVVVVIVGCVIGFAIEDRHRPTVYEPAANRTVCYLGVCAESIECKTSYIDTTCVVNGQLCDDLSGEWACSGPLDERRLETDADVPVQYRCYNCAEHTIVKTDESIIDLAQFDFGLLSRDPYRYYSTSQVQGVRSLEPVQDYMDATWFVRQTVLANAGFGWGDIDLKSSSYGTRKNAFRNNKSTQAVQIRVDDQDVEVEGSVRTISCEGYFGAGEGAPYGAGLGCVVSQRSTCASFTGYYKCITSNRGFKRMEMKLRFYYPE